MAFFLTVCYVALIYLAPAEIFPELAPLRLQLCVVAFAAFASAPALFHMEFEGPQLYLMMGFVGSIVLSLLGHGWLGGIAPALSAFSPAAAVFFLLLLNVRSLRQLRTLRLVLVAIGVLLVLRGAVAYHSGVFESVWVMQQHLGEGIFVPRLRALGVLNDPNDLAQFLLMLAPLLLLEWTPGQTLQNMFVCVPMAVLAYGIFLTHSRGALVGIGVVVALALAARMSRVAATLLALPLALGLVAANFAAGREVSLEGGVDRLEIWSDGLALVKQSLLWGVGYGLFTESNSHTAHNSFLLCAAELGLVGYLTWLALFVVTLWQLDSIRHAAADSSPPPEIKAQASALRLCLWAYLTTAWFLSRAYLATPYVALGMAGALAQIDYEQRRVTLLPVRREWMKRTLLVGLVVLLALYVFVRLGHMI